MITVQWCVFTALSVPTLTAVSKVLSHQEAGEALSAQVSWSSFCNYALIDGCINQSTCLSHLDTEIHILPKQ